jgi:transcription elongation GreA/GreB family factor
MGYRFLRKDYDALVAKIEELGHDMWESGQEKGLWANQSAETWHDNFGYEQEQQHQWALSERAESLVELKNDAEIVERRVVGEVDIGCQVTIEDVATGERRTFVIGSYQVLDQQHENEISYAAPLARPFTGASAGEEREIEIGDSMTVFRVVAGVAARNHTTAPSLPPSPSSFVISSRARP